jgi:hypothetical protein
MQSNVKNVMETLRAGLLQSLELSGSADLAGPVQPLR